LGLASFASVGLRVTSVDRAVAFYGDLLGGEVTRRRTEPDVRVWMKLAGLGLEIAEVDTAPALTEAQRRLLPVFAFNVEPGDLEEVVGRLRKAGVPLHGPALKMAGEAVGVYLADPDGNGLSLSCNSGYPIAGLERRDPRWTPSPYDWAGAPTR
jgi:catechol 2,3-dioxygenase